MRVATHPGNFHADDVLAVAVLGLAEGPLEIVRTRDAAAQAAADARVDVGGRSDPASGDFDHHQKGGAGERENGIRYASFGLVWRAYGERLAGGPVEAAAIDERLVQGVDANDTGQTITESLYGEIAPMSVSGVIAALNPRWDEDLTPEEEDARFAEAVELATGIVAREIAGAAAIARARSLVEAAVGRAGDPRVIELDGNMPWREAVVRTAPEALFVIPEVGWLGLPGRAREAGVVRQPPGLPGRVGGPQRRGAGRGDRRPGRDLLPPGPVLRVGRLARRDQRPDREGAGRIAPGTPG